MKKSTIIILTALFVTLMVCAAVFFPKLKENYTESSTLQAQTESEAVSAADFTVYDKDGADVKLSDFVGKPTVVNFWATWCGYCVEELPDFNKLYEQYKNKVNFVMIDTPYSETQSDTRKFVEEKGYSFPVYFDTEYSATKAYSVSGIPMTLLVNKDGSLYQIHKGMMDEATLRNYIESLLAY